jgi:hypothetical protein
MVGIIALAGFSSTRVPAGARDTLGGRLRFFVGKARLVTEDTCCAHATPK